MWNRYNLWGYFLNYEELEKENKKLHTKIKIYEQVLKQDTILRKQYAQTLKALKEKENELQNLNQNLEKIVKEEIEKNKQKEQILYQQARLVALGEMINNIAHQWRQPLSLITTAISSLALKAEYEMAHEDDIYVTNEIILKNANQLSKTIDTFGHFFEENQINETFTLANIIEKSVDILQTSFNDNCINVELSLDQSLKYYGNSEQFLEVILNILKNAQDVLSGKSENQKIIKIILLERENEFILEIQDNGGGIEEEIIEKIFDPYFTTKYQTQGTGLGLYLCLEIMMSSFGGTIKAKNTMINNERWAIFTIVFPAFKKNSSYNE